ncbi:Rv1355c family protein [soil metagenome]
MTDLSEQLQANHFITDNISCAPLFYRIAVNEDRHLLSTLLNENNNVQVFDAISLQLEELVRLRNPSFPLDKEQVNERIDTILKGIDKSQYGVWVFYPWSNRLVHLLDESEFVELRTARNKYKITDQEEALLAKKKIGIIGLSVGQSVALTLVMERVCGELVIADFDTLELSNLNRIRTGLHNMGIKKTINAAREIAEIDPFIKVTCFHEGVNEDNIDVFLYSETKLDLLIEECDSLDIKVLCRQKAKAHGIPVMMDTNDRGMLDIERYDLDPSYPLFHGLIGNVNYQALKGLTAQQKIPYLLQLIGLNTASKRSKVSLIEMGQSISNFPQLASSVVLGGAIVADVSRRLLLDQLKISGRFYVDVEDIIKDKEPLNPLFVAEVKKELTLEDMRSLAATVDKEKDHLIKPADEIIRAIVADAGLAPSSGNDQPWKWLYKDGRILLFHDISRSYCFGDYNSMASYTSLGSAIENFVLSAHHQNLELTVNPFPKEGNKELIAAIEFTDKHYSFAEPQFADSLYDFLKVRCTNRKITGRSEVSHAVLEDLKTITESVKGLQVYFTTDPGQLKKLGMIISASDRIRILHPQGHHDFYKREMRWSKEEALAKRNGMDINTLEIPAEAMMALKVVSDENVVKVLRDIDGAQAFKLVSVGNTVTASAMGLVTMPAYTPEDFLAAGRAIQRQWLKSAALGYAYQPIIAPLYLFPRIIFGNGEGLSDIMINELLKLRKNFMEIFPGDDNRGEVFLFRIFKAPDVETRSLRLPLEDILFIEN